MIQHGHLLVKCKKCRWVHFARPRKETIKEVVEFNTYFDSLTPEAQEACYGSKKNSIEKYEKCFKCGNSYENFAEAHGSDVPRGGTIQPILLDETNQDAMRSLQQHRDKEKRREDAVLAVKKEKVLQ